MSFPWQNDSADLEGMYRRIGSGSSRATDSARSTADKSHTPSLHRTTMEELPGGILDSTPSPTPSPASSRASTPSPSPSPEPEIATSPRTNMPAPILPPLMRPWFLPPVEAQAKEQITGHSKTTRGREASTFQPRPRNGSSAVAVTAENSQPGPSVGKRSLSPSTSNISSGKRPCRPAAILTSASPLQGQSGQPQADASLKAHGGGASSCRLGVQPNPSSPACTFQSQPSWQAGKTQAASSSTSRISCPLLAAPREPGQASKTQAESLFKIPPAPSKRSTASPAENVSKLAPVAVSEVALGKRPRPSTSVPVPPGQIRQQPSTSRAGTVSTPAASGKSKVTLGKRPHPSAAIITTASQPPVQSGRLTTETSVQSTITGLSEVALGKQRCRSPDIPTSTGQQAGPSGIRKAGDITKTANPTIYTSGRPKKEDSSKSPPAGLSEVARGKQRCRSPDILTSGDQLAAQSGTREAGRASTIAHTFPSKPAHQPIYKSKWATPSGSTLKSATAPRYTSKWATAQPESVPDDAMRAEGEEESNNSFDGDIADAFDAFEEDVDEDFDGFDEDLAEEFDAFEEDVQEEDIHGGEMPVDEEYLSEDEDDGMSVDEEEPRQYYDDDGMSVDEEGRAEEPEDDDMLVDDPEDEDDGMQVDPEPASKAPQDQPFPPRPSDFQYSFHSPPNPQQQEARVPEPGPFFEYFARQQQPPPFTHNPVFTESRQEARYAQPWQSTPAPTWTQSAHSYNYGQQPYTPWASYVPYTSPQPFQPHHSTAPGNYAQSSVPPASTYFYPFQNQPPTHSYTFAQFEYHSPQVHSGQLHPEHNCYAREGELLQTQRYSDEHQPRQSFARAFVAMVRRILKRREGRQDDVQERNEKCVDYAEHEDRRSEEDTHVNDQEEEDENEEDEDDQLQVQIIGAYKPDPKEPCHSFDARQDRQHEGMVENLAKKTGQLIQENKWIALPAIALAVYSFAPTLVSLVTSG